MRTELLRKYRVVALFATGIALSFQAQVGIAQQSEKAPTNVVTITSKDTNRMGWESLEIPQIKAKIPVKILESNEETGMLVAVVRYPAGFVNIWHTHPTAHGMYVLDGILKTHQGEFGPGTWVWYPEGGWMGTGRRQRARLRSCSSQIRSSTLNIP